MNIILSGATGSIGMALLRLAIRNGDHVLCIVHRDSKRNGCIPIHCNISVIEADLSEYRDLPLEGKYDVFIHLAWCHTSGVQRDDAELQLLNIQYTLDAVSLAARHGCQHFVGAGSQSEYGVVESPPSPQLAVKPESGYGVAKFAAGKFASMCCKKLGMHFNWVRILSVYGPSDRSASFISYLISSFESGCEPQVTRCEQTWDYLYSDDAAAAFYSIINAGVDGKTYVLGSGQGRPMYEYVNAIKEMYNSNLEVNYGAIEYYPHQPMYMVADISVLCYDTGWQPTITFEEGLRFIRESKIISQ